VDKTHLQSVLEAALLSAHKPLSINDLKQLFDNKLKAIDIESCLNNLQKNYEFRPVELIEVATGWRFQTKLKYQPYLTKLNPEVNFKYSRAVLETLAVIAYKQPVTRGDIESIRGVTVTTEVIKKLEERGWIETVGHREVIGRPALLATTKKFLDDLGLKKINELPLLSGSNTSMQPT
jgi:segregation and condensation protein B